MIDPHAHDSPASGADAGSDLSGLRLDYGDDYTTVNEAVTRRCCACGCQDGSCEGGPECVHPEEGFPLYGRFYE